VSSRSSDSEEKKKHRSDQREVDTDLDSGLEEGKRSKESGSSERSNATRRGEERRTKMVMMTAAKKITNSRGEASQKV